MRNDSFFAPLPEPQSLSHLQRIKQSALDSGMLDMSAFGLASEAEEAPAALPQPPLPQQQQHSSVESGMLDMSAFGLAPEPDTSPARQPPSQQTALESGMLDLSAFGMAAQPQPAQSSRPQAAVDSGMLDVSAFGGAPEAGPGPEAQHLKQSSELENGMVDMSAFGLASEPDPEPSSHQAAVESGMLDMSSFGLPSEAAAPQHADPHPAAAAAPEDTGRLYEDRLELATAPDLAPVATRMASPPPEPSTPGRLSEPQSQARSQPPQERKAQQLLHAAAQASAVDRRAATPFSRKELMQLKEAVGVRDTADRKDAARTASGSQRANAGSFSLLRLDAPEPALDASRPPAPEGEVLSAPAAAAARGHPYF